MLCCQKETRKAQTDAEDTAGVELTTEEAVEATAAMIHECGNLPIENANICAIIIITMRATTHTKQLRIARY